MKRPIAPLLALLAGLAVSTPARADSNDDARRRYQQGVTAFEKGDFPAAVDAFAAVYKTTNETKHLWNLALAEYKANRTYAALLHLREYVSKSDANPKNVERAQGLITEEAAKSAHLKVVAPAGADILVDGARIGSAPLATPIEVDPDKAHVVIASHGADEATQNLAAPGAQTVSVELSFPVAPPAPVSVASAPPPAPASAPVPAAATESPSHGGNSALRVWLTVGLGVGAVAAASVAVVEGAGSNSAANKATSIRDGMPLNSCRNPGAAGCSSLQSELSTQQSDHVASMVLYGAAGALAAGAVAAWLFVPHQESVASSPPTAVTPVFGANFLGAAYTGRF
jgi:hypothetical protein